MLKSICLHLHGHCIESEAKKEFKRCMDAYFTSEDATADLEERINFLSEFIKETDFNDLRGSDARLEGEKDISIEIFKDRNSNFIVKISG